jgi:uncharacterized protein (DUF2164 family)
MKKKQYISRHYSTAQSIYTIEAEKCLEDFILDELGEDFYKQLRYEAACTSLKALKKQISEMQEGKVKRQTVIFYEQKRRQLEEEASKYDQTPYTL